MSDRQSDSHPPHPPEKATASNPVSADALQTVGALVSIERRIKLCVRELVEAMAKASHVAGSDQLDREKFLRMASRKLERAENELRAAQREWEHDTARENRRATIQGIVTGVVAAVLIVGAITLIRPDWMITGDEHLKARWATITLERLHAAEPEDQETVRRILGFDP